MVRHRMCSSSLFRKYRRVLTNSKFGLFYSSFLILTPTFSKVPIEKYGKNPNFSGKQHFYSYFQNPSEISVSYLNLLLLKFQFCILVGNPEEAQLL